MTRLLPGQLVRLSSRGLHMLESTDDRRLKFYIVPGYKNLYSVCASDVGIIIQPRVYEKSFTLEWLVLFGETRVAVYDYLLESVNV